MYFMIGTGVLAATSLSLVRHAWELHKKLVETEWELIKNRKKLTITTTERNKAELYTIKINGELIKVKKQLNSEKEEYLYLYDKNKNLKDEIEKTKNAVKDEIEISNSLKIDKEKLKKDLKKAEEYHNKVNAEIKKVKAEKEALNRNMDLILNGSRDVRRDFVKNGMKNIELYRQLEGEQCKIMSH